MICLLQLFLVSYILSRAAPDQNNILSAWEETPLLWELCAELPVGADAPDEGRDAEDGRHHDSSVNLPVLWLCVPATSRRPDMLWISVVGVSCRGSIDVARRCRGMSC